MTGTEFVKDAAVVRPVTLKGKIILKSQEKDCDGSNNIWDIPKVSNNVSIQDLQAVMLKLCSHTHPVNSKSTTWHMSASRLPHLLTLI